MKLLQGAPQVAAVQVGVNLCSGDAFMAQHFLNCTEIGPGLYEVGSKGMTEGVRMDIDFNTRLERCIFYDVKDHHPR